MKVLVTGGAGFIGSHLVELLLKKQNLVCVIDNFATGRRENLTPNASLTVAEGTIANRTFVERVFDDFKPDKVVHAAASYKDPTDWEEDARTNVVGTANVVQISEKHRVKRIIYFQTSLCYGLKPLQQPIPLSHPIQPEGSSYAISKTAAEEYVQLSGLDYISFRLANAYGPRNLSGPLPTFYHRLTSNKPCFVADTRRDFIFIDDLVEIVMMALDDKGRKGPYHVATGTDYQIRELLDAVLEALNIKPDKDPVIQPRKPDDAPTILLDPSKTLEDFGWKAKTSLKAGVSRAIQWYKQNGVSQTFTHLKLEEKSR